MSDYDQQRVQAQVACYAESVSEPLQEAGVLYCNRTWDDWGCWNSTPAGTRASIPCPPYIEGFDPRLRAYKDCNQDGSWWLHPKTNKSWANYTTCINSYELEKDRNIIYLFVAGYTISIVAISFSLFIFFYFKQLNCDRVTLHKNLFTSYILNGVVWILYYTAAVLNANVLVANPLWCQILHGITQYFVACNFFWMFCEGLYLHTIIVVAFTSGKKLLMACIIIGWVVPIIPASIYVAVRTTSDDANDRVQCWVNESHISWIVFGPIVLTIVTNLIFLCNIVRVLITKLRAVNSPDTNQTRKAVRATLILIPLLGLQYIIFPLRPEKGSALEDLYYIFSAFVTSFQGLFVALIFCFFNGEVISVVKRKWGQHQLMHGNSIAVGKTTLYTQASITLDDKSVAPPRLYENRCQAPGGKPHKPITKFKPIRGRKESSEAETVPESSTCMLPRTEFDKGECTGV